MIRKSIHEIEISDFDKYPVWKVLDYDTPDGIDILLSPMEGMNEIPIGIDVYVRFQGVFNDKSTFVGFGMIDPYHKEILGRSLLINNEWQLVYLPPAPDFVLEKDGPEMFAKRIKKNLKDIFPMKIITDIKSKITGNKIENVFEYKI